jgi:hypothetical protein
LIVALLPKGVDANAQRVRRHRGHEAPAPGWLKPIADRLAHALASTFGDAKAARITVQTTPAWSDGVCLCEWGDRGEIFFVVSADDAASDAYWFNLATADKVLASVPPQRPVALAINLNSLLAQLRADACERGVDLPPKFTPKGGTEAWIQWRSLIEGPKRAAQLRAMLKGKHR